MRPGVPGGDFSLRLLGSWERRRFFGAHGQEGRLQLTAQVSGRMSPLTGGVTEAWHIDAASLILVARRNSQSSNSYGRYRNSEGVARPSGRRLRRYPTQWCHSPDSFAVYWKSTFVIRCAREPMMTSPDPMRR
ncbi:hypothetical protein VTO42DRAFT_4221 [Malbranchea cinnamomea]